MKKDEPVVLAVMESEHYTWIALGRTPKEAEEAIVDKWNKVTDLPANAEWLREDYGINLVCLVFGEAHVA